MFEKFIIKCQKLRNSKFQVHLSSTKAMFQYMTTVKHVGGSARKLVDFSAILVKIQLLLRHIVNKPF